MTLVICATLLCFYPQLVVLFALNLKCIETEKHNKKKSEAAGKPRRGVGDAKEPINQKIEKKLTAAEQHCPEGAISPVGAVTAAKQQQSPAWGVGDAAELRIK